MPDQVQTPEVTPPTDPVVPAVPATPVASTEPVLPESYDFKTPQDWKGDTKPYSDYAKALKLTPEQAQRAFEHSVQQQNAVREQTAKELNDWKNQIVGDKSIESPNVDSGFARLGKEIPGLKTLLESSGYKNHPDVVRLANFIGRSLKDAPVVTGGQSNTVQNLSPRDALIAHYRSIQGK